MGLKLSHEIACTECDWSGYDIDVDELSPPFWGLSEKEICPDCHSTGTLYGLDDQQIQSRKKRGATFEG